MSKLPASKMTRRVSYNYLSQQAAEQESKKDKKVE
jgi:hypothetical protein